MWKWALSMLIGATMGTLAFMVDWGIDILNNTKYKAVEAKIYGEGAALGPVSVRRWPRHVVIANLLLHPCLRCTRRASPSRQMQ